MTTAQGAQARDSRKNEHYIGPPDSPTRNGKTSTWAVGFFTFFFLFVVGISLCPIPCVSGREEGGKLILERWLARSSFIFTVLVYFVLHTDGVIHAQKSFVCTGSEKTQHANTHLQAPTCRRHCPPQKHFNIHKLFFLGRAFPKPHPWYCMVQVQVLYNTLWACVRACVWRRAYLSCKIYPVTLQQASKQEQAKSTRCLVAFWGRPTTHQEEQHESTSKAIIAFSACPLSQSIFLAPVAPLPSGHHHHYCV